MREYKFRGKRTKTEKFVYGYYMYTFDICYNSQGYDDVPPRVHYIFDARGNFYEVDPETVGQYTGLKDRNGKEIYEGDLLDISDRVFPQEVDMDDGCYATDEFALYELVRCKDRTIEVIGNRWDNPDLLEG